MGRELRRKQAKKEGKSLEREQINEENQIRKLIVTTCIIIIILGIIYLISALFITKELDWFSKDSESQSSETSVSNAILASSIFKQSEDEYYVYFYDFDEKNNKITDTVNKISNLKVYKVNTASAMNSNYIAEVGNKNAKKLDELKVVSQTLIKISGDTITEYYETDEITNKFN